MKFNLTIDLENASTRTTADLADALREAADHMAWLGVELPVRPSMSDPAGRDGVLLRAGRGWRVTAGSVILEPGELEPILGALAIALEQTGAGEYEDLLRALGGP